VYDLRGRRVQSFTPPPAPGPEDEPGRFNNVDLVLGVRIGNRVRDLAIVTDRGRDKLPQSPRCGSSMPAQDASAGAGSPSRR